LNGLDAATEALVAVAAAMPLAPEPVLVDRMRAAHAGGTPPAWLDEVVFMAVLFVGFPRGLVAAGALRAVEPQPSNAGDAADYAAWPAWQTRGEAACRRIYGANYEKLRRNVRGLHPVLDAWIVTDGYGRTISRDALDLPRRELCAIAMLVPQDTPRQLHSHLRGALNVGASVQAVEQALAVVAREPSVAAARLEAARRLWADVGRGA